MPFGSAVNSGHFDANQSPSIIGVIGTLGTADISGTAQTLPIAVDPATGAMYVNNLGAAGAASGTNVNVVTGTQQTLGTVGVVNNIVTGTIAAATIIGGTIQTGTVSITVGTIGGAAANAAIASGNPVPLGGTDSGGTIRTILVNASGQQTANLTSSGTLLNLATGTLAAVTTVSTVSSVTAIAAGTQNTLGTVGVVNNLVTGTIAAATIIGGTIQVGTVVNNGGSVSVQGLQANAAAAVGNPFPIGGTDSGGTVRSMLVDSTGVQRSSGSMVMTVGTVSTGTLQNLVTGTINALASGTITGGTLQNVNYGTIQIDPKPTPIKTLRTTYGTTGTTGAAVFGTLVAPVGAGTFVYISGYQITVEAGTVACALLDGTFAQTYPTGGTNMITRGNFVPSAGVARDLSTPYVSGTNGTICYWMGGIGTAYFQVDYWVST